MADKPTIYEAMAAVLADLPAVGKNQRNSQQNFNYRGIDDVLNELNPVLARHGVFFVPDVLERLYDQRTTRGGGIMHVVNLHVRYTFCGPGGDSVTASAWGEGTDSGDKATNKAMTGAMKYVLFQTFAISDEDRSLDSDSSTPDETVAPPPSPHEKAVTALIREDAGAKTRAAAWRQAEGVKFPLRPAEWERLAEHLGIVGLAAP